MILTIHRVFPLSEKVKVPKLRKGKKKYTEIVKICGKNESFFCEILNAVFFVTKVNTVKKNITMYRLLRQHHVFTITYF